MSVRPLVAWSLLALVIFLTVGPVQARPQLGHPQVERFAAWCLIGASFSFAYPRFPKVILISVALAAALSEGAQFFAAGRDPRWLDGAAKVLGALVGALLVPAAMWLSRNLRDGQRIE